MIANSVVSLIQGEPSFKPVYLLCKEKINQNILSSCHFNTWKINGLEEILVTDILDLVMISVNIDIPNNVDARGTRKLLPDKRSKNYICILLERHNSIWFQHIYNCCSIEDNTINCFMTSFDEGFIPSRH